MPKMSMLREHKSPSKLSTSANVSGNSSNFFDDSIGSFMGPPATSSTASSSNIRHEATKSYDGSKSYMEVWRVWKRKKKEEKNLVKNPPNFSLPPTAHCVKNPIFVQKFNLHFFSGTEFENFLSIQFEQFFF